MASLGNHRQNGSKHAITNCFIALVSHNIKHIFLLLTMYARAPVSASSKSSKSSLVLRKEKRTKAKKLFVNSVSIAGLLELYTAPAGLIRRLWIVTMSASSISILYHIWQLVAAFYQQKATVEVMPLTDKIVPFPNVTACIPAVIKKTEVKKYLKIPPRVEKMLSKLDQNQRDRFIEKTIALSAQTMEFTTDLSLKTTSAEYRAYKDILQATYANLTGKVYSTYVASLPTCGQSVLRCSFDGEDYDCCKNAVLELDDDSVCFALPMHEYDLSQNYKRSPNSPISLQFDLILDWKEVPFYFNDAKNGFSVHLADPLSLFGRPIAVPGGMHAFVDMARPTRKIGLTNCHQKNYPRLSFGYYDARGYNCKFQAFDKHLPEKYGGCILRYASVVPNETSACIGGAWLSVSRLFSTGLESVINEDVNDGEAKIRQEIKDAYAECLPVCNAWEYEPRVGYSSLLQDVDKIDNTVSTSRVTVYIGATFYEEKTETPLQPFYATFVNIGFVMSLYAGFSVITLAEIVFYSIIVCKAYKKETKNKVQVDPAVPRD